MSASYIGLQRPQVSAEASVAVNPLALATAWVNFNGVDGVIAASFNVAGVVRDSAGIYTITFAAAMDNANYAWSGSANQAVGNNNYNTVVSGNDTSVKTTTQFQVGTVNSTTAGLVDPTDVNVIFFGGMN